MKRKIAQKEAGHSDHPESSVPLSSVAKGVVAGGVLGAVVGKAVGRTNGSTVAGAALGAIAGAGKALARPGASLNLPQMVDYLQKNLGSQTTAYLSGADDVALVNGWASGTVPAEEVTGRRLWSAYEATRSLVEAYDALTARAWFMGMNPAFEDRAPARVLRTSETQQTWDRVILAARVFAET